MKPAKQQAAEAEEFGAVRQLSPHNRGKFCRLFLV
jgi:hypothetical protein